ncbi:lanosterol 14-alpha-demethylase [Saccharata proteae CBS 121410]|uniref:Lanosterol 14-alpha-demethylase n=1 Tax=Saccharata proteae CBS 121410 TaxID=1314787 RepID=A0A9P4HPE6_9PEZI|nr:lanosterol 14-alpha-demethylase [Saccharata proteae CBS 121410]
MPVQEKSQLKRGLCFIDTAHQSAGEGDSDIKKPRRSERLPQAHDEQKTPLKNDLRNPLPSPLTHKASTTDDHSSKDGTASPPRQAHRPSQQSRPFSQFVYPPGPSYEVENEDAQGVWGYLIPLDTAFGDVLVLRRRAACPVPEPKNRRRSTRSRRRTKVCQLEAFLLAGIRNAVNRIIQGPTISNRHCLLFTENRGGDTVAILEDLSANGTFVNDTLVGRNKRRELNERDEISIVGQASCSFRYPRSSRHNSNGFKQQYSISEPLGKGHFASVYLAIEKCSGKRYAVKKFEKRSGPSERSRVEGLQQEIAVLMSVSHPSLLCLKDTFDESDGVYLVLELAAEGELFNWIVMKRRLSEAEARKVFVQLFQAVKYLHERNIVHRDIKPENILLTDKDLNIKLADFGLAKIIGEESFTTTLCGTPSYVAPEILESSNHRRYTRAVDVWSLGVVLYICLCGFPPFSDELYSPENPFTLSQQIKMGRFDYPSPYWDSVGDPALDLIDRMLTVDVDKRISIDECLEHPWTRNADGALSSYDSTDGLAGAMGGLDFSKRKPKRERTLLSSINDVQVSRVIETKENGPPVKIYKKNPVDGPSQHNGNGTAQRESSPAKNRQPDEFMALGGKGDQTLFELYWPYPLREIHGCFVIQNRGRWVLGLQEGSLPCQWGDVAEAPECRRCDSLCATRASWGNLTATTTLSLHVFAMGLLAGAAGPLANTSTFFLVSIGLVGLFVLCIVLNVLAQLIFRNPKEPPVVFHWIPFIGSTVTYGMDPYGFFFSNREKHGDVFTFILLGKKTTVCLGTKGNDFILNGKLKDVNAEEVYSPLTTPVFGKGVVYDCPNSKLMEQKKFVKFGLTSEALRSYVDLITGEVHDYIKRTPTFKGQGGTFDVPRVMAEVTIFTASRSLQGKEVRDRFDSSFADLYHDLDMGFTPINFMLPWAPLPHNKRRDMAHNKMVEVYSEIIQARREGKVKKESEDMIWNLMGSTYKNGTPLPDREIACILIALLMAGQHSSSSTISWILLRLASRPDIAEQLYEEQKNVLGADLPPLTHEAIQKLPFHAQVVKETLRIHAPIHSIMRKVKSPLTITSSNGKTYNIPTSHVLLASPGVTATAPEYFPNPEVWEPHRWDGDAMASASTKEEEQIDYGYGMVSKGTNSPYLPFGAGRHRCIGEQFAYVQLQTILANMVREFKFRNVDGSAKVVDTDYSSLFSQPMRPAVVQWERREKA